MPEDIQTLLEAARWTLNHQKRRSTLRQLAKTEENYLLLVRELDRVEGQCLRARAFHAEATLTLVEWLETLNTFHWRCAYCQEKPFQILSHLLPLPQGGTTVTNCVPACYHCVRCHKRKEREADWMPRKEPEKATKTVFADLLVIGESRKREE